MRTLFIILLLGLFVFGATNAPVNGQELEPRTYANIPVNMNFLAVGYGHSSGNVLLDPSLPIEDLDADTNYAFIRYTRSLGLFGNTAKVKALLPYAWGQYEGRVDGTPGERKTSGVGDAVLGLDVSFLGAPALSAGKFDKYRQKTIMGASVRVVAPTGDYDNTKIINIGSNRWAFKGELGASRQLGKWTLELAGALWAFTDNTDRTLFVPSKRMPSILSSQVSGWGSVSATAKGDGQRSTASNATRISATGALAACCLIPLTRTTG